MTSAPLKTNLRFPNTTLNCNLDIKRVELAYEKGSAKLSRQEAKDLVIEWLGAGCPAATEEDVPEIEEDLRQLLAPDFERLSVTLHLA
jgi:hypothetical protein